MYLSAFVCGPNIFQKDISTENCAFLCFKPIKYPVPGARSLSRRFGVMCVRVFVYLPYRKIRPTKKRHMLSLYTDVLCTYASPMYVCKCCTAM